MLRPQHLTLVFALSVCCLIGASACSKDDDNPTTPVGGLELNSGTIANGAAWPHTFATAGTFGYHCTIHGGMSGTVTVVNGNPTLTATVDIPGNLFSPNAVTIGTGGTVTWTNNGGTNHTVTSH